jgi:molybdenum cofactor guanylyltransferase
VSTPFSAVVLAGGRSTRMGTPKALVEVDGLALWRRQVELTQRLEPTDLMISTGEEWSPGEGPWSVIRDRVVGRGPLGGIDAALRAMSTGLLLVLAVDMPAMSQEYLRGLIDRSGPFGVVPESDGFYEGLAAVYPRSIGGMVERLLAGEDHSIQRLVGLAAGAGLVVAAPISKSDRALFRNVNRPSDL